MLDVEGVDGAVAPFGEVGGGSGFGEGVGDGGGEEVVPVGEALGEPARRGVLQELFEGVVLGVPGVEFGGVELAFGAGFEVGPNRLRSGR